MRGFRGQRTFAERDNYRWAADRWTKLSCVERAATWIPRLTLTAPTPRVGRANRRAVGRRGPLLPAQKDAFAFDAHPARRLQLKALPVAATDRHAPALAPPWRRDHPPLGTLHYRDQRHEALPHVVKFSGGRSSGALVLEMAAAGALSAARGDVVLFANTSAEHPRTYEFAAHCCDRLERDYALPCFWYEFCTVEDAYRGVYRRRLSYRLVTRRPIEEDPNGYAPPD